MLIEETSKISYLYRRIIRLIMNSMELKPNKSIYPSVASPIGKATIIA